MIDIRKYLAKSYLGRLYKGSKLLFIVINFFFAGTIISNFLLIPTTPFFVWDMFSSPAINNDTVTFYQVKYNGHFLPPGHTWKSAQSIILINQLKYYADYKNNINVEYYASSLDEWTSRHPSFKWLTPTLRNPARNFVTFPGWYKNYISVVTGQKIYNVSLVKKRISYSSDHSVHEISTDTLVTIK